MTVQSPPYALQNGSHSAAVFRQALSAAWQEGGPVQPSELWVAAQSTPNMSVQVGAGRAIIQGSQASAPSLLPSGTGLFTSQADYFALNDAAVTVTIAAADPTNPRIDVVYVAVQDSFYSGSNNQALVGVVTGTPAPSPVAPAAPANAEVLATVSVAANATSITNGVITNKVSPATPIGQPVDVDTYAHLQLWSPLAAGTYADVYNDSTVGNNGLYRWTGSGWVFVAPSVAPGGRVKRANAVANFGSANAWAVLNATANWQIDQAAGGGMAAFAGTWIAPIAGVYDVEAQIRAAAAVNAIIAIKKNSTTADLTGEVAAQAVLGNNGVTYANVRARVRMNASDYVSLAFINSGASTTWDTTADSSFFGIRYVEALR